jgi:pyruvate kinase
MCSIGKHSCTLKALVKLLNAGMNVARISMAGLRNEIENQQNGNETWDWNSHDDDIYYD